MRFAVIVAALIGSPMLAQEHPTGCYHRSYDTDHLAANPDQTVAALSVDFYTSESGLKLANIEALVAKTPGTINDELDGKTFSNVAICGVHEAHPMDADWVRAGSIHCGIECDGGFFEVISVDAQTLVVRTDGLRLTSEDSCGGPFRMRDEGAGPTTYKLFAVPMDSCTSPSS